MKKIVKSLLLVCVISLACAFSATAHAATLYFSSPGQYSVGQTVPVTVFVSTDGQAINAVSSIVTYPQDKLQLLSISKTGSIITFWTQDPSFSNANGQAQFEGVAYNPGFTGQAGQVVTLTFKVKATGTATLSFSQASVLANDGMGTNVLNTTKTITLSLGTSADNSTTNQSTVTNGATAPHVYSPTHPNPQNWYSSGDVTMKWDVPQDVTAVKISYDKYPSSSPTVSYSPAIAEKSFSLTDGVWYFHVQEENADGWGPVSHFKLQIDTAPPGNVSISFPDGASSLNTEPRVAISATDALSGIDHYDLRVDDGTLLHIMPSDVSQGIYTLSSQNPGKHKLEVSAYDKAGNSSSRDTSFEVLGLSAPVVNPISDITEGDFLEISGTTLPNVSVTLSIVSDKNVAVTETGRSDNSGNFTITVPEKLSYGAYSVTAMSTNDSNQKTYPSAPVTFSIKHSALLTLGTLAINYVSIIFIALALLAAFGFWIWYLWHILHGFRRKILKKVDHAEAVLHRKLSVISTSVIHEIERLEGAKNHRKLTDEEESVIKELKKSLADIEESIKEEIETIKDL